MNRKEETVYEKYIKRGLDIVLSLCALACLLPMYLGIALAIEIDDPGPVFFVQKRIGKDKMCFSMHKFRSMKMATPHDTPTHLLEHPEQYITGIGRVLRKYSLDELPQIWDILVGNLSVIGPRPALWNQLDLEEEREQYGANDVKPGLTGWAQIHGRDELAIPVKAKYDGEYVKELKKGIFPGFFMDVKCFFGTIGAVLKAEGVHEGRAAALSLENEKKKKYLIITNHSYMLWQFRRELIAELLKSGEVVISTPFTGHEKDFEQMGCRLIFTKMERRGTNPAQELSLFCFYRKMLKEEAPDRVFTYSIKPNLYAGCLCQRLHIPYCAQVQGLGSSFQKKWSAKLAAMWYRRALGKAEWVFFENAANAEYFRKEKIVQKERQTVLGGAGVNLEYYEQKPYPSEANGIHVLFLGRIMKEKGVDELFEAAKNLKKQYGDRILFELAGFFEEGYREKVEQLSKDGILSFYGFRQDPRPLYEAAHVVVLPSYHEGMSNVLLEAAATGRALITSDIPGCRESVEDGKNGYLCRAGDAESLEQAIRKFMEQKPQQRERMGILGREKMESEFDRKVIVKKTLQTLKEKGETYEADK